MSLTGSIGGCRQRFEGLGCSSWVVLLPGQYKCLVDQGASARTLFPPLVRKMGAFNGLYVQVQLAGGGIRSNGGISRVRQGTRLAGAEARLVDVSHGQQSGLTYSPHCVRFGRRSDLWLS